MKELLMILEELHEADKEDIFGICDYVESESVLITDEYVEAKLRDLFRSWPHYSGSIVFPIPGGGDAYEEAYHNGKSWDRDTEYGALRWNLLEHCIKELRNDLH